MNSSDIPSTNPLDPKKLPAITTLLCIGDSNTWGFTPGSGAKIKKPWPTLLQEQYPHLNVVSEALPGRTTRFAKPQKGLSSSPIPAKEYCSENTLLIIMLGTNDLCTEFNQSAAQITANLENLLEGWPTEQLLIIAPPFTTLAPYWLSYFKGQECESRKLAAHYQQLSKKLSCGFIDSSDIVTIGSDGVHFEEQEHCKLASSIINELSHCFNEK